MCGGGDPGDGGAAKRERQRQDRIRTGVASINDTFAPFNDDFFAGRSKAYVDYATPQLKDQYQNSYRNLVTALHRSGILQSTEGARRMGELQKQYKRNQQGVIDTSVDVANNARTNIENSRSALISDLQVTADPSSALQAAQARQAVFAANPTFQPLANLFTDVTGGLAGYEDARQNALLRNQVSTYLRQPGDSSSGSVKPSYG
jgi:hypothetical protein